MNTWGTLQTHERKNLQGASHVWGHIGIGFSHWIWSGCLSPWQGWALCSLRDLISKQLPLIHGIHVAFFMFFGFSKFFPTVGSWYLQFPSCPSGVNITSWEWLFPITHLQQPSWSHYHSPKLCFLNWVSTIWNLNFCSFNLTPGIKIQSFWD